MGLRVKGSEFWNGVEGFGVYSMGFGVSETKGVGGSSSLLGPIDPSFRALPGRLKFAVRRHEFNKDSLILLQCTPKAAARP